MFAPTSGLGSSSLGLGKEVEFAEVTEEEGESWGMEAMSFMLALRDWSKYVQVLCGGVVIGTGRSVLSKPGRS